MEAENRWGFLVSGGAIIGRILLILGMAVLGAVTGGLGLFGFSGGFMGAVRGAMFGMMIGNILAAIFFPVKLPTVFGPRLDSLVVSSAANGQPIPIPYGQYRYAAQIIASPGLVEHSTKTKQGGKGGPPSQTSVTFTYTASFAAAFGEGPGTVKKVWGDTKVLFDASGKNVWHPGTAYKQTDTINDSNGNIQEVQNAGHSGLSTPNWRTNAKNGSTTNDGTVKWMWLEKSYPLPTIYPGTEFQVPDPLVTSFQGVNATPAFRGLIYAVWENLLLSDWGNRLPNLQGLVAASLGVA